MRFRMIVPRGNQTVSDNSGRFAHSVAFLAKYHVGNPRNIRNKIPDASPAAIEIKIAAEIIARWFICDLRLRLRKNNGRVGRNMNTKPRPVPNTIRNRALESNPVNKADISALGIGNNSAWFTVRSY